MNNALAYAFICFTFIDSQRKVEIKEDKMLLFWTKSRFFFFLRLFITRLKNNWEIDLIIFGLVVLGAVLQVIHPSILVLGVIMYISNTLLQHNNHYSYIKYILYVLPVPLFIFGYGSTVYWLVCVILCVNLYMLFTFTFNMYQGRTFRLPIFDVTNMELLTVLGGGGLGISALLLINHYNAGMSVEELLCVVLVVLLAALRVDISTNKMIATRVGSRFSLVRSKSSVILFDFLIPKQKYEIFATLFALFLTTAVFAVVRQQYLVYILLFIGCIVLFLMLIDYIVQHILLGCSVIYDNVIMRNLLDGLLNFFVFSYVITFVLSKYITTKFLNNIESDPNNIADTFVSVFGNAQVGYAFVYFGLIVFFGYRLYKTFTINRLSSVKVRKPQAVKKTG